MKIKKRYIVLIITVIAVPIIWFLTQFVVWKHPIITEINALSGKWESTLLNHLAHANRLRIIYDRANDESIEITDTNEIQNLLISITIDEEDLTMICMELNPIELVFRNDTNKLASIILHNCSCNGGNGRLYWIQGSWPKSVLLTQTSSSNFFGWINNKIANQSLQPTPLNACDEVKVQGGAAEL